MQTLNIEINICATLEVFTLNEYKLLRCNVFLNYKLTSMHGQPEFKREGLLNIENPSFIAQWLLLCYGHVIEYFRHCLFGKLNEATT